MNTNFKEHIQYYNQSPSFQPIPTMMRRVSGHAGMPRVVPQFRTCRGSNHPLAHITTTKRNTSPSPIGLFCHTAMLHSIRRDILILLLTLFVSTLLPLTAARSFTAIQLDQCGASLCTASQLSSQFTRIEPNVGVVLSLRQLDLDLLTEDDFILFNSICTIQHCVGIDLSLNALVTLPTLNATTCSWCSGGTLTWLNLESNSFTNAILGSGYPLRPTGAPAFLDVSFATSLTFFSLSHNPIVSLPPYFGSPGNWFTASPLTATSRPTFKCASCQLNGLPDTDGGAGHAFATTFHELDLSGNSFLSDGSMNWAANFLGPSFGIYFKLNMSNCGLTRLPNGLQFRATSVAIGSESQVSPYTSVLDFSHNAFSTNQIDFTSLQFAGTLYLYQAGLTAIKSEMFLGSAIGNIILSKNSISGSQLNLTGISLWISLIAPTGSTGNLYIRSCGLTTLNGGVFNGVTAYAVDLSGNSFATATSFGTTQAAFQGISTTYLYLQRASMTASTLESNSGQPFQGAVIHHLVMDNGPSPTHTSLSSFLDDGDMSGVGNMFDPLPNLWLIGSGSSSTMRSIERFTIGDIVSVSSASQPFFGAFTSEVATVEFILRFAGSVSPLQQDGPILNMLTGYSAIPLTSRLKFSLTVEGSIFAYPPTLPLPVHLSPVDVLYPDKLTFPLHPAFLVDNFFHYLPFLRSLEYVNPSSYSSTSSSTPWDGGLTLGSISANLLCGSTRLKQFGVVLASDTYPPSPINTLPDAMFQCFRPDAATDAQLNYIDIAAAQLTSYTPTLFAGLTNPDFTLALDFNLLYNGTNPIPIGQFDGFQGQLTSGPNAPPLTDTVQVNIYRSCPYIVSQSCASCPDGSYSRSVSGYSYCARCKAGSYCTGGKSFLCPAGSYQPTMEQSSCIQCPTGTSSALVGQEQPFTCLPCAVGRFNPFVGNGSVSTIACQSCRLGEVAPTVGSSTCTPCSPGKYSDSSASSCIDCQPGRFAPNASSAYSAVGIVPQATTENSCIACPDGSVSVTGGASTCHECAAGTYMSPTRTVCLPCGIGLTSSTGAAWSSVGVHANATTDNSCRPCQDGYISPLLGSPSCLPCPIGYFMDVGRSSCSACAAGRYGPRVALAYPSVNSLPSANVNNSCLDCEDGFISSTSGAPSCVMCPIGTFMDPSRTMCRPCGAGRYGPRTGLGYSSVNSAPSANMNNSCLECSDGFISPMIGAPSCVTCPAGTYMDSNRTSCQSCAAGRYGPKAGLGYSAAGVTSQADETNSCQLCPDGFISPTSGASVCQQCVAGTYMHANRTSCRKCAAGRYSDDGAAYPFTGSHPAALESNSCRSCPNGTISSSSGASECAPCGLGQYMDTGRSSCSKCGAGRYGDVEGIAYPFVGNKPWATDSNSCRTCPDGAITVESGSTVCTTCAVGSYMDPSRTVCKPCAAGRFGQYRGTVYAQIDASPLANVNNSCVNCGFGFTSLEGSSQPTACTEVLCGPGQYYDAQLAIAGGSGGSSGASTSSFSPFCFTCPAGFQCAGNALAPCLTGVWSPPGSSVCTPCQTQAREREREREREQMNVGHTTVHTASVHLLLTHVCVLFLVHFSFFFLKVPPVVINL